MAQQRRDVLHLVMLLAHLLKPVMLGTLLGAETWELLVIVPAPVAVDVHGAWSLGKLAVRYGLSGSPREAGDSPRPPASVGRTFGG